MKLKWNLLRPQYSLRVMLICLVLLTVFVARHREGLRDRLEVLWAGKLVNHILIVGPQTIGPPAAIAPPDPDEIAAALERAGKVNRLPKNVRLVIEPLADYVDPPKSSSGSQWHHAHYKCQIMSGDGARTIYIDHNHLCLP